MCWQGRASQTHCVTPPTAHNWAYGMWTQPFGNGHYELSHTFVKPESFFYAQLAARMGKSSMEEKKIFVYTTDETTKPTPEYAHWMSVQSLKPDMRMDVWIDSMIVKYPLEITQNNAPLLNEVNWRPEKEKHVVMAEPLQVKNGWIVRGNHILINGTYFRKNIPGTTGWQGYSTSTTQTALMESVSGQCFGVSVLTMQRSIFHTLQPSNFIVHPVRSVVCTVLAERTNTSL